MDILEIIKQHLQEFSVRVMCNSYIKCQLIWAIIEATWVRVKLGIINEWYRDFCGSKVFCVCNKRYNRRTSKAFPINSVNPKKVMRLRKQSCASSFDKLVIGRNYDKIAQCSNHRKKP